MINPWKFVGAMIVAIAMSACGSDTPDASLEEDAQVGMSIIGLDGNLHQLEAFGLQKTPTGEEISVRMDGIVYQILMSANAFEVRRGNKRLAALVKEGELISVFNGDGIVATTSGHLAVTPELAARFEPTALLLLDSALVNTLIMPELEPQGDIGTARQAILIPLIVVACCVRAHVGSDGWAVEFNCNCLGQWMAVESGQRGQRIETIDGKVYYIEVEDFTGM